MSEYVFTNYLDAIGLAFEVEYNNLVGIPQGITPNSVRISSDIPPDKGYDKGWLVCVW